MQMITLKNTGLSVSRACFGTMTFGGQADKAESARMIDFCFDKGINFLDTANAYNKGASEEILGEILKGRRNRVILASKVRNVMGPAPDEGGLSRKAIFRAIEDSLRRLQTDYLDIYYLHAPDPAVPIEETLEAIDKLRTAGKIRSVASSNYAGWQVAQMFAISDKKGYQPPYLSQHMYNLMARGIEQEYLPMCKEYGVSSIVYNPLAGGMLTGKQTREAPLAGTRFDKNQMYLDRFWHPDFFNAVDALKQIADAAGRSMISLSLNWLLHHTQTDCVILGASRLEQLQTNLQAMDEGPLTADTLKACDEVWAKLRGVTPKYNR
jgi:aryl-alcohol dehydrogenase-like predicted oxidoreductase